METMTIDEFLERLITKPTRFLSDVDTGDESDHSERELESVIEPKEQT
jgi:hypothetical protein